MKTLFNIATVLLVAFSTQSCNLLSAAGVSSQGQPTKEVKMELTSTTANSAVNVDHSEWNSLLKKHVNSEGLVDYKGFKKDQAKLDGYLKMLSEKNPSNDWSVQELLAYYINIYNAATVKLIVENYPVKSIKDIDGNWTKGRVSIGSKELSLGGIENGILRKMNEPRIHFAINCASISCPKILNEAFTAAKINEQLDRATKEFINSDKNDISANSPKLSSVFDWYQKDFKMNGKQDVIGYINQYSKTKINMGATISYKDYNWNLNEQK
ncbi:Protein of unknown function, DUF547 [Aequorivita sublithincola DSM 14238]|uniref:DUF547 domain-containing protein n=1 Tax=Aequorivita sublithincola (strain DSM 14238 / LMG 21431 / ACAM 643 / 9-3) TaxID=746697 RepID=I3YT68_AEQSU|nr:DUF547 domain-containing protein [Aequorivita sublithincola]AFL80186.1 Protein of unknown function, DUF547 [Aequorivita sublithincola DSM 14238]